jgi:hypothetical protein
MGGDVAERVVDDAAVGDRGDGDHREHERHLVEHEMARGDGVRRKARDHPKGGQGGREGHDALDDARRDPDVGQAVHHPDRRGHDVQPECRTPELPGPPVPALGHPRERQQAQPEHDHARCERDRKQRRRNGRDGGHLIP